MLVLESLTARYGHVEVVHGVSLELAAGEVLALLGRNGAGKTTVLRAIMGLVERGGRCRLDGHDLAALPAHRVPRLGVAYVPQGRGLFPRLTVAENLRMGLLVQAAPSAAQAATLERVLALFPALRERLRTPAGTLSGGQQQMLATARALCTEPRVLLLDEPTEGLMPSLVETVLETIETLRAQGVAVLLVEQKVAAALRVASRVLFLENGTLRAEHTAAALAADPEPLHRYVGLQR